MKTGPTPMANQKRGNCGKLYLVKWVSTTRPALNQDSIFMTELKTFAPKLEKTISMVKDIWDCLKRNNSQSSRSSIRLSNSFDATVNTSLTWEISCSLPRRKKSRTRSHWPKYHLSKRAKYQNLLQTRFIKWFRIKSNKTKKMNVTLSILRPNLLRKNLNWMLKKSSHFCQEEMKRTKNIRTLPSANYRMASIKLKKFKVSDLKME